MALSRKPPLVQLRVPFILHEFNTLLRCEQRHTDTTAYRLKYKTQRVAKKPRVANHS